MKVYGHEPNNKFVCRQMITKISVDRVVNTYTVDDK